MITKQSMTETRKKPTISNVLGLSYIQIAFRKRRITIHKPSGHLELILSTQQTGAISLFQVTKREEKVSS